MDVLLSKCKKENISTLIALSNPEAVIIISKRMSELHLVEDIRDWHR